MPSRKGKPRYRQGMIAYLKNHPMHEGRYAVNVKLHRITPIIIRDAAFEILDELQKGHYLTDQLMEIGRAFQLRHSYLYQLGFSGRSSGWRVLHIYNCTRHPIDGSVKTQWEITENREYDDWETSELRDRVAIVWEFDKVVQSEIRRFLSLARARHYAKEKA